MGSLQLGARGGPGVIFWESVGHRCVWCVGVTCVGLVWVELGEGHYMGHKGEKKWREVKVERYAKE